MIKMRDIFKSWKTSNIEHPTTNIQWSRRFGSKHWMFDVRCWLLDVEFSSLQRQFNREPAAFANFASHAHASAMRFDNMFHDAQTDSNSLRLASQFGTAPVKSFENLFLFLNRNSRAVVGDGKCQVRSVRYRVRHRFT